MQVTRSISKHQAQTDDTALTALKNVFEQQASIQDAVAKTMQETDDSNDNLPAALLLQRGAMAKARARAEQDAKVYSFCIRCPGHECLKCSA